MLAFGQEEIPEPFGFRARLQLLEALVASEVLECFGGAGYVEDTGLPLLLRDAQVLPIWEGTTNVLSLDTLRALSRDHEALATLIGEAQSWVGGATDEALAATGQAAIGAMKRAAGWLVETMQKDPLDVEAGARRFALTLGRSLELALLVRQAQFSLDTFGDPRTKLAALRFAEERFDLLDPRRGGIARADARALAMDEL